MRNCSTSHGRTNDTEWVSNLIRTADDPGENDRSITHQLRERERETNYWCDCRWEGAEEKPPLIIKPCWVCHESNYIRISMFLSSSIHSLRKINESKPDPVFQPERNESTEKNKNDNNHIARIFLMPFGCDCRDKRSSVWVCVCLLFWVELFRLLFLHLFRLLLNCDAFMPKGYFVPLSFLSYCCSVISG